MREIKFRAKAVDLLNTQEFVYGYYWTNECDNHFIITTFDSSTGAYVIEEHDVDPETVGEYTGLNDKNGREIYEGDILRARIKCGFDMAKGDYQYKYKNYAVEYWQSFTQIGYRFHNKSNTFMIKPSALRTMQVEVIGNIHDNPELLKEELK